MKICIQLIRLRVENSFVILCCHGNGDVYQQFISQFSKFSRNFPFHDPNVVQFLFYYVVSFENNNYVSVILIYFYLACFSPF